MSESPFITAESRPKRLKLFLWGETGSGKTTTALQFPSPVVIDTEGGTDLYSDRFKFDVLRASDADSIIAAVDWLGKNEHEYRTVVIDPITIFWDAIQKKWSDIFLNRNKGGKGFKFEFYEFQPKDWMTLKGEHKELLRRLTNLDMNVVVTARGKTLFSDDGQMKKQGETFDGEKNLPYLFDVVVQTYTAPDGTRHGRTVKDRSGKLAPDFLLSPAAFLDGADDTLTRKAEPDLTVTEAQVAEIRNLAAILDLKPEDIARAVSSRGFDSLDTVSFKAADDMIASLKTRIGKETDRA